MKIVELLKENISFQWFWWVAERPEIPEDERTKVSGMCANFTEWLDTIIDEIKTFKVNGVKIPIIFRLFHFFKSESVTKPMRTR